jgi:hypothetical protein
MASLIAPDGLPHQDLSAAQRRADQLVATSQRERSRASSHVASRASTPCPSDDGSHPNLGGSSAHPNLGGASSNLAALQEEVTSLRRLCAFRRNEV